MSATSSHGFILSFFGKERNKMANYSIEEIKIAALDAMMENSVMSITGIPFLAAMLEKLAKQEQTVLDLKEPEPEPEETEAAPEEPAAPSAPSFFGQQAALKCSVYERLQACRAKGMSSVEISKLTGGKVTPDEVMEILAGAKIPFIKWKALDSVLDKQEEES